MATSVTSASAASMKRITGLVSGLDVDSLVKQMIVGQQSKLDKANQQKQLIDWKKSSYRSVISKISEFQNKFLDVLNPNSVLRTSAFKSSTANIPESASKYVSVSSASDSMPSSLTINKIQQVATSQTIESVKTLSSSTSMKFDEGNIEEILGETLSVTLDGVTKSIKIASDMTDYYSTVPGSTEGQTTTVFDAQKVADDLNEKLKVAFGAKANGEGKIKFEISQITEFITNPSDPNGAPIEVLTDSFSFKPIAQDGSNIKLSGAKIASELGFQNDWINYLSPDRTLGSLFSGGGLKAASGKLNFSINGVKFEVAQTATLKDVMNNINASSAGVKVTYSELTDKLTFTSVETGSGNNIVLEDLNGTNFLATVLGKDVERDSYGDPILNTDGNPSELGIGKSTIGTDAIVTIDGKEIIRNSNTFTVNGVKIQLLEATSDSIPVTGGIDSTKAVANIKEFVNSYNEMMSFLNGLVKEEKQKGYTALTDAQKAEMSDRDIENWEAAAKSGLLRGDSAISKMISDMRTAMISMVTPKIGNGNISLASIGIATSSTSASMSNGILTIDEAKLSAAIERDPEAISRLFTQTSDIPQGQTLTGTYATQYKTQSALNSARFNTLGIAQRIAEIVTSNINVSTSSTSQGSLIKIAGTDGANKAIDNETTLGRQLTSLTKTIDQLQDKLYNAEDKAYLKLSKLETALSKLNSQSSYLSNQ